MPQLLLLIVSFLIGIVLARTGRLPAQSPAVLNAFIVNVSLPALVLARVHDLPFRSDLLLPIAVSWFVFLFSALIFLAVGRWLNLDRRTLGCLMLAGGLGNTSFVGLPMIEAFFGKDATGIGVLADQPGTFLILSTLGMIVAARASGAGTAPRAILGRVLRFPPFLAMLLAVLLVPVPYPAAVTVVLERIGDTLAPLALISVGMQLRVADLRGNARPLALGLFVKMALAPAAVAGTLAALGLLHGTVPQVSVFEAAMPPMITGAIVAMDHELNRPLAVLMLGVGIPLGFATLPLWWWLLSP